MIKKKLSKQDAVQLMKDILLGNVKTLGTFQVGFYNVSISEGLTSAQRVKNYYEKNPEARKELYKKKKERYRQRRANKQCVKCGMPAINNKIFCNKCRERDKLVQIRRRMKDGKMGQQ